MCFWRRSAEDSVLIDLDNIIVMVSDIDIFITMVQKLTDAIYKLDMSCKPISLGFPSGSRIRDSDYTSTIWDPESIFF